MAGFLGGSKCLAPTQCALKHAAEQNAWVFPPCDSRIHATHSITPSALQRPHTGVLGATCEGGPGDLCPQPCDIASVKSTRLKLNRQMGLNPSEAGDVQLCVRVPLTHQLHIYTAVSCECGRVVTLCGAFSGCTAKKCTDTTTNRLCTARTPAGGAKTGNMTLKPRGFHRGGLCKAQPAGRTGAPGVHVMQQIQRCRGPLLLTRAKWPRAHGAGMNRQVNILEGAAWIHTHRGHRHYITSDSLQRRAQLLGRCNGGGLEVQGSVHSGSWLCCCPTN